MSLRETSARASELLDSIRATFHRIGRLFKEPDRELVQDIHEQLKQHEEAVELLQQDAEVFASAGAARSHRHESEKSREIARLTALVARLGEDLKHARSQFRRAQLSVNRAGEARARAEREARFTALKQAYSPTTTDGSNKPANTDLFAGRRKQTKQLTEDELLINTSSDITAALRATHDKLTSEIGRSRFASETLAQSTAALTDLGERYSDLDTLLANSKTLLTTLVKSQKSDTWYLETAFYVLLATLAWLVFRRLIYGPAWWFIWFPLRYCLFKPFAFLLTAFGGSPDGVQGLQQQTATSSRRPLIVHNSAKARASKLPEGIKLHGMPAGAGGRGAKLGPGGGNFLEEESLAEKIGRMAEEGRREAEGRGAEQAQQVEQAKNPKKRMFEADVEDARYEAQQGEQEQEQARVRDEL